MVLVFWKYSTHFSFNRRDTTAQWWRHGLRSRLENTSVAFDAWIPPKLLYIDARLACTYAVESGTCFTVSHVTYTDTMGHWHRKRKLFSHMSEPFFCVWARNSELTSNLFNKRYYKTTCVEEKKDENMAPYVKTVREPLIKHSFFFGGGGGGNFRWSFAFSVRHGRPRVKTMDLSIYILHFYI